jgi:hypothetical protein
VALKDSSHHRRLSRKSKKPKELVAQLAPLEELESGRKKNENHDGAIVVDTGEFKLPKGINEVEDERAHFHLDNVVIVILLLAATFIGFITWLIATGPE